MSDIIPVMIYKVVRISQPICPKFSEFTKVAKTDYMASCSACNLLLLVYVKMNVRHNLTDILEKKFSNL